MESVRQRYCEACERLLDDDQERFCGDMCRETFQEVYGGGNPPAYYFDSGTVEDIDSSLGHSGCAVDSSMWSPRREHCLEPENEFEADERFEVVTERELAEDEGRSISDVARDAVRDNDLAASSEPNTHSHRAEPLTIKRSATVGALATPTETRADAEPDYRDASVARAFLKSAAARLRSVVDECAAQGFSLSLVVVQQTAEGPVELARTKAFVVPAVGEEMMLDRAPNERLPIIYRVDRVSHILQANAISPRQDVVIWVDPIQVMQARSS